MTMSIAKDPVGSLDLTALRGLDREIPLDSRDHGQHFLLVTRNGSHLKLASGAYNLVQRVYEGHTFEEIASEFSACGPKNVSETEVREAYGKVERSLRAQLEQADKRPALPTGFWFTASLVPAEIVTRLANLLRPFFYPLPCVFMLTWFTATVAWALQVGPPATLSGTMAWPGFLLFLGSLLVHELGHASASAHFGAKPREIGFGMYLIYPVLYSDVTAAWQLRRWQRVIVDLGGPYLHMLTASIFFTGYLTTGWPGFWMAATLVFSVLVFSLNPIFRFDGYWVLADSLGVTNLSRQPATILRHLAQRLRGKTESALPWPTWLILLLSAYSLGAILVWGYFLFHAIPAVARQIAQFPSTCAMVLQLLHHPQGSPHLYSALADLSAQLVMLLMVGTLAWKLSKPLLRRSQHGTQDPQLTPLAHST